MMDWRHWVAQQFSTYSTHIVARPKLYLLLPLLCAAFRLTTTKVAIGHFN